MITSINTIEKHETFQKHKNYVDLVNSKLDRKSRSIKRSQSIAIALISAAEKTSNHELKKSLWPTYHCQTTQISENGILFPAGRCKKNWCPHCLRVKQIQHSKKYYNEVKTWTKAVTLTLTTRGVRNSELENHIKNMKRVWTRISARLSKRAQRSKNEIWKGIRALEAAFDSKSELHRPHFHFILPTKALAEEILAIWMEQWPEHMVDRKYQEIRTVKNYKGGLEGALMYIAKGSPIFKVDQTQDRTVAKAGISRIKAMKGVHTIRAFGLKTKGTRKAKHTEELNKYSLEGNEVDIWVYSSTVAGWELHFGSTVLCSIENIRKCCTSTRSRWTPVIPPGGIDGHFSFNKP